MAKSLRAVVGVVLMLPLILSASGCMFAASRAGGAAARQLNDQGVLSLVQGSISEVDRRAQAVLTELGLQLTSQASEDDAAEREYQARNGERVVNVKLEVRTPTTTLVTVSTREGRMDYSKNAAWDVIDRIQRAQ